TMGIPVRRGRDVSDQDRAGVPGVVVVNESLAARHWPGEEAIGKRLALADSENRSWLSIVGIVKDSVRSRWGAPPEDELFLPYAQVRRYVENPSSHFAYLTLVVRTSGDPAALAPALRSAVWARERNAPISDVRVLEDVVEGAVAQPRFYVLLLGAFAAVALALAAVGIYAVISFSVARRTNEIGIRMALGAERSDVLRLVVGQGLRVGLVGALGGIAGAFGLTRLMSTMLYGVGSHDPATFAGVVLLLAVVAVVASYLPARRATRIDPLRALRYE